MNDKNRELLLQKVLTSIQKLEYNDLLKLNTFVADLKIENKHEQKKECKGGK